jgi:hypothetical protein
MASRWERFKAMFGNAEEPLERIERQMQEVKKATVNSSRQIVGSWSELDDAARLRELELEVEWPLVSEEQKETLLAREVDFSEISRDQLNAIYEDLGSYDIDVDERAARRLFDKANAPHAEIRSEMEPQIYETPPPAIGMTRLYHGGHGPVEESRWFTSSRNYAEGWARGGQVHYVDLPTDHPLIEPEWPDQSIARGFTWNGVLLDELATQAKRLVDARENERQRDYDPSEEFARHTPPKDTDRGMER